MKKRIIPFALAGVTVLCLALANVAIQKPVSGAEAGDSSQEEIKQLEQERNQALLRGDTAALDRMTSSDYTFINQRGELRTKAEIVSGFKSGTYKYEARQISDLRVRVYGNTAIVTGRAMQKGVENTKDYSGENRFTRVYVKQEGRWVSVALQVTLVAKP